MIFWGGIIFFCSDRFHFSATASFHLFSRSPPQFPSALSSSFSLARRYFFCLSPSVFCTVPRHQSFVGALAGTTSRFEISTARWNGERWLDVFPSPRRATAPLESYLFQAPSSLPPRAFALLGYVITTLIVLPLSVQG